MSEKIASLVEIHCIDEESKNTISKLMMGAFSGSGIAEYISTTALKDNICMFGCRPNMAKVVEAMAKGRQEVKYTSIWNIDI